MNYTEMEAKVCALWATWKGTRELTRGQVREATNNEPWGASTTLMQEIANGTFN
jgi:epsin